jgi:phytoene synthase
MQLTNIARDVVEDAQRGRCYIPSEWGLTSRAMSAPRNAEERNVAFTALQRLLALSDDFYAFSRSGISAIPRHNRRAIRIAAALYQGIGRKILRQGPNHYWQGRTFLTRPEKIAILAQTLLWPELPLKSTARDVWHDDLAHLVGVPGFPTQRHA